MYFFYCSFRKLGKFLYTFQDIVKINNFVCCYALVGIQ